MINHDDTYTSYCITGMHACKGFEHVQPLNQAVSWITWAAITMRKQALEKQLSLQQQLATAEHRCKVPGGGELMLHDRQQDGGLMVEALMVSWLIKFG